MKNKPKLTMAVCLLSISACATKSADIVPLAVPHTNYDSYDCSELKKELNHVNESITLDSAKQNLRASNDTASVVGGVLILIPLFFIKGDDITAVQLAQSKGEVEAINIQINDKKCE